MKKDELHDFYLTEAYSGDSTGYMVKNVNRKGIVVQEVWIPIEQLDWFQNRDYKIVSREEFEEIGKSKE
jgi:hypothetical protein